MTESPYVRPCILEVPILGTKGPTHNPQGDPIQTYLTALQFLSAIEHGKMSVKVADVEAAGALTLNSHWRQRGNQHHVVSNLPTASHYRSNLTRQGLLEAGLSSDPGRSVIYQISSRLCLCECLVGTPPSSWSWIGYFSNAVTGTMGGMVGCNTRCRGDSTPQ